jgi:hypothetical protein
MWRGIDVFSAGLIGFAWRRMKGRHWQDGREPFQKFAGKMPDATV